MSFNLDSYIDVAERIRLAKELYPEFSLQSSFWYENIEGQTYIIVKAYFYRSPEDKRPGIGHAWEIFPGKTPYSKGSELMVCETSAFGRAAVAVGIGAQRVASKQEVKAAQNRSPKIPELKKALHKNGAEDMKAALALVTEILGTPVKDFSELEAEQIETALGKLNG